MTLLAPRIGNEVSYVTQIIDDLHFCVWQVQYLMRLEGDFTCSRIGNDVSYVRQIPDDLDIAWQAQYLVRLPGDFTFSAHWK